MNSYSLTYIFVIILTAVCSALGINNVTSDDIQKAVTVVVAIGLGLGALYGRYRAGGITKLGVKTNS